MDEIEIEAFRADTKASKGLTAAHIAEAASLYDPEAAPAPLVFGHPAHDAPALGLISGARADGNKLFLRVKNIAQGVVDAVKERRILNRSIAFWDPHHPSNPNPGKFSIRHLGLLGGMAPAIPGMTPLRFSADELTLEPDGTEDIAPAPAIVFRAEESAEGTPVAEVTETVPPKEPKTMPLSDAEIADLQAKAARADAAEAEATRLREADEQRTREFAASEKARREGEDKAALDRLTTEGKILPAERGDLEQLFNALPTTALTFSAGAQEPRQALTAFLDKLPKRTPGATEQPASPGTEFNADDSKAKADAALAAANQGLNSAWKGSAS